MDDSQFTTIIGETKAVVLAAIRRHLRVEYYNAIDDVAQETYLRAYKSLKKNAFRGDSSLRTWLYAIARNESLRMNQKLDRDSRRSTDGDVPELPYHDNNEEKLAQSMDVERLTGMIRAIPEKYRKVLQLHMEGKSEREISNLLNLKKGTVKSRLSRGKSLVRRSHHQMEVGS